MQKTQQQAVRDALAASAHSAAHAASTAWSEARSTPEKLALLASLTAILAFFAPTIQYNYGFLRASLSAFRAAREGHWTLWLLLLAAILSLLSTWYHLHHPPAQKQRAARLLIALGAASSFHWLDTAGMPLTGLRWGGWLALAASATILAAGWVLAETTTTQAIPTSESTPKDHQ